MELRQLRYFVQVVESGSLTQAAAALGVVTSALSQQITRLEGELSTRLLQRGPGGMRPTDAGLAFWRQAQLALRHVDEAGRAARTARLAAIWDDLRAAIAAIAIAPARLRAILAAAGAPTVPADLGWSPRLVDDGVRFARALRDRYTFLDLAADGQQPPHG